MRNAFINEMLTACNDRQDLFIISGDAGLGVFDEFRETYRERFLNMGIAEQNTISFAAGLSLAGFKVIIYNIAPFVLYRCYEQVRNDVCYQRLPMVLVGIGSGITYAPGGMTHYAVEDIGIAQTLPNLTVISPIDPIEAKNAAHFCLESSTPVYVRLAKRGEPILHACDCLDISGPQVIRAGRDIAIIFHGSIAEEAIKAHALLERDGISPLLLSVPMVQPLNTGRLLEMLKGFRFVVSVEEHFENCGLGSILAKMHVRYHPSWELKILGIPYSFIHEIKDSAHMRQHFRIGGGDIAEVVRQLNKTGGVVYV